MVDPIGDGKIEVPCFKPLPCPDHSMRCGEPIDVGGGPDRPIPCLNTTPCPDHPRTVVMEFPPSDSGSARAWACERTRLESIRDDAREALQAHVRTRPKIMIAGCWKFEVTDDGGVQMPGMAEYPLSPEASHELTLWLREMYP